jgi:hypothetical protein
MKQASFRATPLSGLAQQKGELTMVTSAGHWFRILLLAGLLILPILIAAANEGDQGTTKALDRVQSPSELADIYKGLLIRASDETLNHLKAKNHTGIAIQAAWECVRRTMNLSLRGDEEPERIDPSAIQRFLGFVEGRLAVSPPDWWEKRLAKAKYRNRDDAMLILGLGWIHPYPVSQTAANIFAPRGVTAKRVREGLSISVKNETLAVPLAVLKKADEMSEKTGARWDSLSIAVVDKERFVVVFYPSEYSEFPLFCLSKSTGKVLWEAEVWPGIPHGSGGDYSQVAEIKIADGLVYIFGLTEYAAYLEAFSLSNGENKFHFGTSYY